MGFIARRRAAQTAAVLAELEKNGYTTAAQAAGAKLTSGADLIARLSAAPTTSTDGALPRNPLDNGPFGPGSAIFPASLDPLVGGHPQPRRAQYQPGWNLNLQAGRLVPWTTLRDAADRMDLLVKFREVRKRQLTRLDWTFVPTKGAVSRLTANGTSKSRGKASESLRHKYESEVERLTKFWRTPDRGWDWHDWLSALLEDHFVLDAVTIYPRLTLAGKLLGLELIDGSTVKPLLDETGGTPRPPYPAYQQILWGFPRGEYTASDGATEFPATDLIYRPRFRRTWTPYGYSLVEQSLIAANLYQRRQEWLLSEYTQGSTPKTWLLPDDTVNFTPEQRKVIESALNDDLSGQTAERHRLKITPPGFKVQEMLMVEARYKADYDMHIINLLGAIWCVPLTEAGFSPIHGGLGANGMAEEFEDLVYRGAVQPDSVWLTGIINQISRDYLGMSDDLTFAFEGMEVEDELNVAKAHDIYLRDGATTLNRIQAKLGEPLYDFPEADEPFITVNRGVVFLRGELARQEAETAAAGPLAMGGTLLDPTQGTNVPSKLPTKPAPAKPASPPAPAAAKAALAAFERFAGKRAGRWRDFDFAGAIPDELAGELNLLGAAGDLDAIKAVVSSPHLPGRPTAGVDSLGTGPDSGQVGIEPARGGFYPVG